MTVGKHEKGSYKSVISNLRIIISGTATVKSNWRGEEELSINAFFLQKYNDHRDIASVIGFSVKNAQLYSFDLTS